MEHDRLSKMKAEKGHYFNCLTSSVMITKNESQKIRNKK